MGSGSTAGDLAGGQHQRGEGVLPEPVAGSLPGSLIAEAARREGDAAADLPDEVAYHAYEAGDQRFVWIGTPVSVEGEGFQFFYAHLRRGGDGESWEFVDIDPHDSPEDAMMAAGREWLKAAGGPDVPTEPVADW